MGDIHFRSVGDPPAGLNGGVSLFQFIPRVLVNLAVNEELWMNYRTSLESIELEAFPAQLRLNYSRVARRLSDLSSEKATLGIEEVTECDIFYSSTRNTLR